LLRELGNIWEQNALQVFDCATVSFWNDVGVNVERGFDCRVPKLLLRFLDTMAKRFPAKAVSREALEQLNPDKIYVENVRSLLNISHSNAVQILDDGLNQGWLLSGIEVRCPDGSVAAIADSEDSLPQTVFCTQEEGGHPEEVELPTQSLQKVKFYRLNDRATSIAVGQAT
jgi:hypothetical protein